MIGVDERRGERKERDTSVNMETTRKKKQSKQAQEIDRDGWGIEIQ